MEYLVHTRRGTKETAAARPSGLRKLDVSRVRGYYEVKQGEMYICTRACVCVRVCASIYYYNFEAKLNPNV